jgi:hypothetical protein
MPYYLCLRRNAEAEARGEATKNVKALEPLTRQLRRPPASSRGFVPGAADRGPRAAGISSPFAAAKDAISRRDSSQSVQVSGFAPCKATEAVAGRRNASWANNGPSRTQVTKQGCRCVGDI